jgi:hypothetical protein
MYAIIRKFKHTRASENVVVGPCLGSGHEDVATGKDHDETLVSSKDDW